MCGTQTKQWYNGAQHFVYQVRMGLRECYWGGAFDLNLSNSLLRCGPLANGLWYVTLRSVINTLC